MALAGDKAMRDELDSIAEPDLASSPLNPKLPPKDPLFIASYRVLERIGEGGMGVVYRAEQREPIYRVVAIKIVKLGMDTHEVVARFEAERQALAMMNHPNVARIFEAGVTEDGRPYFVMEYVRGEPITGYCDQRKLSIRQRLELVIQACDAVQHAHQKAIIHRDIKPNNLLVTLQDQAPVVKVIDFGVAKALGHRLTEHTLHTEHGKLIGTPEYMSPEQAEISGVDIDIRSDIYSLGVVMYELLAGALPFDSQTLRTAKFDELRRIIREQEPPRPSQRLTTLHEEGTTAAAERGTDLISLHRALRSELEWMPLKAMNKDRAERYRSAAELADDVHNYLAGRPLIAGPHSQTYRLRKFVRKHRRGVALAAGVLLVIVGLVVALAVETRHAIDAMNVASAQTLNYRQAAERAEQAEQRAYRKMSEKLILVGDSQLRLDEINEAQQTYLQSLEIARGLNQPTAPLLARLYALDQRDLPLSGYYRKDQGVGGFAGAAHINSLALAPDGFTAATTEGDTAQPYVRIWDLRTGILSATFPENKRGGTYVSFSPDGRHLLAANFTGSVQLLDLRTRANLGTFAQHPSDVFCTRFSPSGQAAASGDLESNIDIWNPETFQEIQHFGADQQGIGILTYSPDGRMLLSGGRDGSIKLWDLAHRAFVREVAPTLNSQSNSQQINDIAFVSDDHRIVSACFDGTVRLWDLNNTEDSGTLLAKAGDRVWRVAVSPNGKFVASGEDNGVRLWDLEKPKPNEPIGNLEGQSGKCVGLAFSKDGRLLVASGEQSAVRVWQMADRDALANLPSEATCAAIDDEGIAAVGTRSGAIVLYDTFTCQRLRTLVAHRGQVRSICISPDGQRILSCGQDGVVKLWNLASGQAITTLSGHSQAATAIAFLSSTSAVSAGEDRTLRFWDLASARQIGMTDSPAVTSLAVSANGRTLLCGMVDGSVTLRPSSVGTPIWNLPGRASPIASVAFTPDGLRAMVATRDGEILSCDLARGTPDTLPGKPGPLCGIAMLSDSNTLWSAGQDGTLGLWDLGHRALLRTVPARYSLAAIALCPNGLRAVCLTKEGAARVLDFARPAAQEAFERRLPQARQILEKQPSDSAALAAFCEWLALRGEDLWASSLLEQARASGADISPLMLGRCYWRLGRLDAASREFAAAKQRREAAAQYLDLCLAALAQTPGAQSQPSSPATQPSSVVSASR